MARRKTKPIKESKFGTRIAELRKQSGITMKELSRLMEISDSYISLLESGERQPSRDVVVKLAHAFYPEGNDAMLDELLIAAGFMPINLKNLSPTHPDLITIYEQALRQTPNDFDIYTSLIRALIKAGKYEKAQDKIQQGFQLFGDFVQLQSLLSTLELTKGNFDAAIVTQSAAIDYYRTHANGSGASTKLVNLLLNLGVAFSMKGFQHLENRISARDDANPKQEKQEKTKAIESFQAARLKFQEALEQDPQDLYIMDEYARASFNLADLMGPQEGAPVWEDTISSFKTILATDAKDTLGPDILAEVCVFLAHAYTKSLQFDAALERLNIMTALAPNEWLGHYATACLYNLRYEAEKEPTLLDKALATLQRAISINDPHNSAALQAMGDPDLKALRTVREKEFKGLVASSN